VTLPSAVALVVLVSAVTAASQSSLAQRRRLPEGAGAYPPRYPPTDFADGSFMLCKWQYSSVRWEAMGIGWSTDYPYAGINLMIRMSELTRARITTGENGEPTYWVVRLTDDALFHCPIRAPFQPVPKSRRRIDAASEAMMCHVSERLPFSRNVEIRVLSATYRRCRC
jgi:hypothetical protein